MKNLSRYFKIFIIFFLVNFLILISFCLCLQYNIESSCQNALRSIFFFCSLSLVLLNLFLFLFLKRIDQKRKAKERLKREFKKDFDYCFKKACQSYNLAELSKIYLGFYHDLANILSSLNLALEQLSAIDNKKCLKRELRKITNLSDRANNLLLNFKNCYQLKSSTKKFSPLKEIQKILEILNFYFIRGNIKVKLNFPKKIHFYGDAVKFSRVILNLLTNSIDALAGQASGIIKISLKSVNNFWELSVSDSGRGVSPSDLDNIFKPFFSSKNNSNSCGLGLPLVKKILAEDFSASIQLESISGLGSSFIILLPKNKLNRPS